ncbi:MAG TPA: outer membrane beta-barrel protein, partial [Polyangiaceae bacterium]
MAIVRLRTQLGIASFVVALAVPRAASAFERQWHLGVDAGYAQLFGQGGSAGFGGGAHLAYGISDMFNVLVEVDASDHPAAGSMVWSGGAGAVYTFDVARAVPYAGAVAGIYAARGDFEKTAGVLQFVLGLDYEIERNWAIGIQLRAPIAALT